MSLSKLQDALSRELAKKNKVDCSELQSHFAELMLDPGIVDPKIPFELSDALRGCLVENVVVNRVYEIIDRILTLQSRPEDMWGEMLSFQELFADESAAFRHSKVADGTTLRACFRILSYMRVQGMVPDLEGFLRETEEAFAENAGRVGEHNEFLFLAADLFTDLLLYGRGESARELKSMLGVRDSMFVLRAVAE